MSFCLMFCLMLSTLLSLNSANSIFLMSCFVVRDVVAEVLSRSCCRISYWELRRWWCWFCLFCCMSSTFSKMNCSMSTLLLSNCVVQKRCFPYICCELCWTRFLFHHCCRCCFAVVLFVMMSLLSFSMLSIPLLSSFPLAIGCRELVDKMFFSSVMLQ